MSGADTGSRRNTILADPANSIDAGSIVAGSVALALWKNVVGKALPAATNFMTLAWVLTGFLVASGVVGLIRASRNEGRSPEENVAERGGGTLAPARG